MQARLGRFGRMVTLVPLNIGGGEGNLFTIAEDPTLIVKLFHAQVLADSASRKEKKIESMKGLQPRLARGLRKSVALAWPLETIISSSGQFLGYAMPLVKGVSLFRVYHPPTRPASVGASQILSIARHLCLGLKELHADGIVVGDINGENILVGPDGAPIWIDTDSMQITVGGETFFCLVGRPEFLAPQLLDAPPASTVRTPADDLYAIAVLLFHLFTEGDHPFRAHWKGIGAKPSLVERIRAGHWPHDSQNQGQLAPPAGSHYDLLPADLKVLFHKTFVDGIRTPLLRPSLDEWVAAIETIVSSGSFHVLWRKRRKLRRSAKTPLASGFLPRMLSIANRLKGASPLWTRLFGTKRIRVIAAMVLAALLWLLALHLTNSERRLSEKEAVPQAASASVSKPVQSPQPFSATPPLPALGSEERQGSDGLPTPKIWARLARDEN